MTVAQRHPYAHWIDTYSLRADELPVPAEKQPEEELPLTARMRAFGYTNEQISKIIIRYG